MAPMRSSSSSVSAMSSIYPHSCTTSWVDERVSGWPSAARTGSSPVRISDREGRRESSPRPHVSPPPGSPPLPPRSRVVAPEPAAPTARRGRCSPSLAMTPNDGGVQVLAQYLAADDHVWRRLLALHVADSTGHCAGCRSATGGAPVWPCTLHALALEVRAINRRRAVDQDELGEDHIGGRRRISRSR
jgi:hypothetical protein